MDTTKQASYYADDKFNAYFECEREEMLAFITDQTRTVLDVGCGAGGFGQSLKARRGLEVWGIELDTQAAERAAPLLDRVLVGTYPSGVQLPEHYFDCIVFNDVLEHMIDPWSALEVAHKHLTETGYIVASVPNIRYLPFLYRLLVRGEWKYTPTGILDKTHLRFFTKRSMMEMFTQAGFEVLHIEGIYPYRRWQVTVLGWILPRFVNETKYIDYALVARPK
jgi:2-polyprenyl-3-methyl-5-hydroxy-6-metoxy-1,4-benzoquinol methylase